MTTEPSCDFCKGQLILEKEWLDVPDDHRGPPHIETIRFYRCQDCGRMEYR